MAKYLDPKADLTFKKIFGEHPDLVISLLNALLPLDEKGKITDIEGIPHSRYRRHDRTDSQGNRMPIEYVTCTPRC